MVLSDGRHRIRRETARHDQVCMNVADEQCIIKINRHAQEAQVFAPNSTCAPEQL
eukprot:CAMPEP_0170751126 /NCGR_PEP_ID=MMETSP0437-20130122/11288_1 /TAXON_ID=0 /ORGANISM="Sexangularia sp." /LENGTH=54 /DNA_ID=CAMNT_0011090147 /DNA_START=82 /DNA_END=243 /DNA_ORIENTATION=-